MESSLIKERIDALFVTGRYNCTMTVVAILSESFEFAVEPQVLSAAQAMPGAGGVGGLCGLVSGALMFIGVWGGAHGLHRSVLRPVSSGLTQAIQERFGSIDCRDLRLEEGCGSLAQQILELVDPYLHERLPLLLLGG